jgi:hypothetical protein
VERVDSEPHHGEVPGTEAFELRKGDAKPDQVVEVGDAPGMLISSALASEQLTRSGSPTIPALRSPTISHARRKSSSGSASGTKAAVLEDYNEEEDGDNNEDEDGFGDDFDDFEEGEEDAEFGDFDDGFQEQETIVSPTPRPVVASPSFVSSNLQDKMHFDDSRCDN